MALFLARCAETPKWMVYFIMRYAREIPFATFAVKRFFIF
jgi:hypothetical protein